MGEEVAVTSPRNTFNDLWAFFSTKEKPLFREEMFEFWSSLTLAEKHYFMCQNLN
jgi:hypothetical protein